MLAGIGLPTPRRRSEGSFVALCQRAGAALRRVTRRRLFAIHDTLSDYTMVSAKFYVPNLELAEQAAQTPGAIVECGTWKGGMIAGIAKLLGPDREYFLFDSFEGLPEVEPIDGVSARRQQNDTESPRYHDNCRASEADAIAAMSLAGIRNAHVVKGWFEDTLPSARIPNGIALLRMDADWYKSTRQILDALFPQVNVNGLIVIDDYYTWDGCSKAVHDYLSAHQRPERISSHYGVAFIIKREVEAALTTSES